MVAISLYRGNLHSVADVPRRWLMPPPKISPRDFKTLFNRRSKALCRLRSTTTTTTSNPNSNHNEKAPIEPKLEAVEEEIVANNNGKEAEQAEDCKGGGDGGASSSREDEKDGGLDGADFSMKPAGDAVNGDPNPNNSRKPDDVANNPSVETKSNANELDDEKEKRKREIEDKLQVLNAKKHNLVKALKQILNVEEELKRRNSTQGMLVRPSVQLQVDVSNDSGSMTRHPTPRMGSEANPGGDIEGGEAEDISNHNTHSRHVHRMSSTSPSPSSESPLRRPPYIQPNVVTFHTPLDLVWEPLLVHHDLLQWGTMDILQTYLHCLYQAHIMPHPLLPRQHLVVPQLLKMLGIQVHGIRSFTRT